MAAQPRTVFIELPLIRLIVVRAAADEGAAIRAAWQQLEAPLASLRSRRFYGVCYEAGAQQGYYAGLEPEGDAEIAALGFPTITIPAGEYVRLTVKDWQAHVADIPELVNTLRRDFASDLTRPTLEFYRSQKELHLLVPLREAAQSGK